MSLHSRACTETFRHHVFVSISNLPHGWHKSHFFTVFSKGHISVLTIRPYCLHLGCSDSRPMQDEPPGSVQLFQKNFHRAYVFRQEAHRGFLLVRFLREQTVNEVCPLSRRDDVVW